MTHRGIREAIAAVLNVTGQTPLELWIARHAHDEVVPVVGIRELELLGDAAAGTDVFGLLGA